MNLSSVKGPGLEKKSLNNIEHCYFQKCMRLYVYRHYPDDNTDTFVLIVVVVSFAAILGRSMLNAA
jgi:hypothetical protein